MKTIVTGVLAFIIWSAASTYWYVNKIKDFGDSAAIAEPTAETKPAPEPEPSAVPEQEEVAEVPEEPSIENPGVFTLRHEFDQTEFIKKASLTVFVEQTTKFLQEEPNSQLYISGHTDSYGSSNYNLDLALKRATAVRKFLMDNGIAEVRIQVRAMGEDDPIADNSTEEGRALNRRTMIEIK